MSFWYLLSSRSKELKRFHINKYIRFYNGVFPYSYYYENLQIECQNLRKELNEIKKLNDKSQKDLESLKETVNSFSKKEFFVGKSPFKEREI